MLMGWRLSSLPFPKDKAQEMGFEFSAMEDASKNQVRLMANHKSLEKIKGVYEKIDPSDKKNKLVLKKIIKQNEDFKNVTVIEDSLNCQDKILENLFNAGALRVKNKYGQFPASKKPIRFPVCKKSSANNVNQDRFFSSSSKKENRCLLNGYSTNLKKTIA
jgi:hypothetical protein